MRAYTYKPEQVGLAAWPSGELRLAGFEPVDDPLAADVFVCPGPLSLANNIGLGLFPFMAGNEDRHVFLDVSDDFTEAIGTRCILIRCNMRVGMLGGDPNSIAWAWPVEDFEECIELPAGGFKYDVTFQGWLSTETRISAAASCRDSGTITSDIATYSDFTGYIYHEPEGIRRRAEFRRSMRESRVALCPESIPGVLPYRFFEAMSAARVPVLVGSDYVLPFADQIPYNEFCLFIDRPDAAGSDSAIREFLDVRSDVEIIQAGRKARRFWSRFLNREDWPQTMADAVGNKMREAGLCV